MTVEIQSQRFNLDAAKLEYIPAPPKPPWFDEELARLMPRTPVGDPFLQIVWGMDEKCFRNGNPQDAKYIAAHEKITVRKFRRLDLVEGKYEYFNTRDEAVKAVNIRLSADIQFKNFTEVRHWGPPRWILQGYMAPERFGTPKQWQKDRYADITDPWGNKVHLDCNGPYPSRGQYRQVWKVQGPEGEYRELDRWVMTECARLVSEHKTATVEYNRYTDAVELSDRIAKLVAEQEAEDRRIEDEFMDHLGPSRYRLIEGNAFSGYGGTASSQARAL